MGRDVVAKWKVTTTDGVHTIEFEHGTTTGKRVIWVDGREVLRKEWMFKLVGKQPFRVNPRTAGTVHILSNSGWAFDYMLEVDGKSLEKFHERQSKIARCWTLEVDGEPSRVVLERDTLDVWCNGKLVETSSEFVDGGAETHFLIGGDTAETGGGHPARIRQVSSGNKKEGIVHLLFVDDKQIPEATE